MHSYLSAIGFSCIKTRKQLDQLLKSVEEKPDHKMVVEYQNGHVYGEMSRYFGSGIGITICGEYDEDDHFYMEYYYPFMRGGNISSKADVVVEKHGAQESYAGVCDDIRLGVTLIYFLQNAGEYLNMREKGVEDSLLHSTTFSGLAVEGKILLPLHKDRQMEENERKNKVLRKNMIAKAIDGDEEAIENLTLADIDTYSSISKRIRKDDVFTIVESYFMPYGVECDLYSVMGEISDVEEIYNTLTGEKLYRLCLRCKDVPIDIVVPQKELLGVPEVGRRYKGLIWMQGYLNQT